MPLDGQQQQARPLQFPNYAPPQAMTSPYAQGALNRFFSFARRLTASTVAAGLVVAAAELLAPADLKPSHILGSFHGKLESEEITAKQPVVIPYKREEVRATVEPQINGQIEQMTAQAQIESTKKSLGVQEDAAQVADLACIASPFVMLFGNTENTRAIRDGLAFGCGAGNVIRANINQTYTRAVRENSAVMQRSVPVALPEVPNASRALGVVSPVRR